MANFKSISLKMAVLQGGGQNLPPHVCVIQKTQCAIGLNSELVLVVKVQFFKKCDTSS